MKLSEAKKELERLDNNLEYQLKQKEILFRKTQPGAVDTTKENVQGGKREDKYLNYVETLEEKQINEEIDKIYAQRNNLERWINTELKIIGEYEPLEQEIITLREVNHLKWRIISIRVGYSERQCQRIYDKYYKRARKRRTHL